MLVKRYLPVTNGELGAILQHCTKDALTRYVGNGNDFALMLMRNILTLTFHRDAFSRDIDAIISSYGKERLREYYKEKMGIESQDNMSRIERRNGKSNVRAEIEKEFSSLIEKYQDIQKEIDESSQKIDSLAGRIINVEWYFVSHADLKESSAKQMETFLLFLNESHNRLYSMSTDEDGLHGNEQTAAS